MQTTTNFSPVSPEMKHTPMRNNNDKVRARKSPRILLASVFAFVVFGMFQVQAAIAAVTFESKAESEGKSTSIPIGKPSGTVAGNLLLATIGQDQHDAVISAPSGWTLISRGAGGADFTKDAYLAIFYKIAGSSEPSSYSFTSTKGENFAAAILRYSGVDTAAPVTHPGVDSDGFSGNKSTTPTAPSVSTVYTNTKVVRIFTQKQGENSVTSPTGTVERVVVDEDGNITLGVADSNKTSTGSTGSAVFTTGQDKDWRAATVVLVPQQVQLGITKIASPETVDAGAQANYTVTVNNTGGATATGVVVTDSLPTGFSFASGSVSTGGGASCTGTPAPTVGSGTPQWGTCQVPAGGSVTITYAADIDVETPFGKYGNTASVDSDQTDPIDATAGVKVLDADVAVAKTVNFATPNEGDTVVFTVTATNNGGGGASNVVVTDTLPAGLSLVSANASQGSGCSGSAPITCQLGTLANGASATVTISASVDSGLGDLALLTNTASVAADQNDPVAANDTATASVTSCPAGDLQNSASVSSSVGDPDSSDNTGRICTGTLDPDPSLSLVKSASPMSYGTVGQVISYSFLVTNTGNLVINGLSVADDKTTNESCPVTTLAVGDSTTCTASYTITQADLNAGSVTNSASASGTDQLGGGVTSNTDTATVTAIAGPALDIAKSASPSTYTTLGETINYSFLVTNTGNVSISGLTVADDKTTNENCPSTTLAAGRLDHLYRKLQHYPGRPRQWLRDQCRQRIRYPGERWQRHLADRHRDGHRRSRPRADHRQDR